jgi:glycosyltransferase involved in cell wall biosynthesis
MRSFSIRAHPVNIAFDISSAVKPERTGMANTILSLIKPISEIDRENDYYLCCRLSRLKHFRHLPRINKPNFHLKIIQEPFNLLFPRQIDIFHSGGTRLPHYHFSKTIVTMPDVLLLLTDEYSSKGYREKKLRRYYDSAQHATRIITCSNFSKQEIVKHLKVPEEKIEVIYSAMEGEYHPRSAEEVKAVRTKYQLGKNYIFYVGIITKRKNVLRMLEAFHLASHTVKNDCEMVMAGKFSLGKNEFMNMRDDLALQQKVKVLGYVPAEDLPALYTGAQAFFFPSVYEGFGIPILEAMACGTPVITSSLTALPEIAGGAALLADPYDAEALASALVNLLEDEVLQDELRQKGLKRAEHFSWTKAAREILKVYDTLR